MIGDRVPDFETLKIHRFGELLLGVKFYLKEDSESQAYVKTRLLDGVNARTSGEPNTNSVNRVFIGPGTSVFAFDSELARVESEIILALARA